MTVSTSMFNVVGLLNIKFSPDDPGALIVSAGVVRVVLISNDSTCNDVTS